MNILEQIIIYKRTEVQKRKDGVPIAHLKKSTLFDRQTFSLKKSLVDKSKTGIIAEFKRKSPSKGVINDKADVTEITAAYADHGASGLSILTDTYFFGGSNNDIISSRNVQLPVLRKEFIIDEYQIIEAKAIGADAILLIAAIMSPAKVKSFTNVAHGLGLEVLLEIHDKYELDHIHDEIDMVGVNNRDLKTFEVNLERSASLSQIISNDKVKISESGIHSVDDILYLKQFGFDGFLIGENFMKQPNPAAAFVIFTDELNKQMA